MRKNIIPITNKKKVRIVIIDDEKELVSAIREFLEARGYAVSCAYNGKSGLEVVKENRPRCTYDQSMKTPCLTPGCSSGGTPGWMVVKSL